MTWAQWSELCGRLEALDVRLAELRGWADAKRVEAAEREAIDERKGATDE